MKKDIEFPTIEGIKIAIVREQEDDWYAYIINQNEYAIQNVLITTKGYGQAPQKNTNKVSYKESTQKTSVLRHVITELAAQSYAKIERVDAQVFGLYNEFWLSYYYQDKLYDKKFIFVPDSITPQNCQMIEAIGLQGVLHS